MYSLTVPLDRRHMAAMDLVCEGTVQMLEEGIQCPSIGWLTLQLLQTLAEMKLLEIYISSQACREFYTYARIFHRRSWILMTYFKSQHVGVSQEWFVDILKMSSALKAFRCTLENIAGVCLLRPVRLEDCQKARPKAFFFCTCCPSPDLVRQLRKLICTHRSGFNRFDWPLSPCWTVQEGGSACGPRPVQLQGLAGVPSPFS